MKKWGVEYRLKIKNQTAGVNSQTTHGFPFLLHAAQGTMAVGKNKGINKSGKKGSKKKV